MKPILLVALLAMIPAFGVAQENPGWLQSFTSDADSAASYIANDTNHPGGGSAPSGREPMESSASLPIESAAQSLGEAVPPIQSPSIESLQTNQSAPPGNEADQISPEIQALAAGLRNDPVKIFEYVHNFIRYECYYGSKKGAQLTLLEGGGNDFDQAALLVALLRSAGLIASYQYGPFEFSYTEFVNWWGLAVAPYSYLTDSQFISTFHPLDTSAAGVAQARRRLAVYEYSKNAGYFYVEPWTYAGIDWFSIPFCAVKFSTGGTDYLVSPAFKFHDTTTGIDLVTATGYNRGDMLSSAGGTTGSPDYVTGLNEAAIGSRLASYTGNLLAYIRANHDAKPVLNITGGRTISLASYSSFGGIPPMYPDTYAEDWCPAAAWTAIPAAQMDKLDIQAGTYNYTTKAFTSTLYTQEITTPSLAGKKISLSFSGGSASVHLDEAMLGSAFTVSGTGVDIQLQAKHNHYTVTYHDTNGIREPGDFVVSGLGRNDGTQVATYLKGDANAYVFAYSPGDPAKHLRKRQEQLDAYRRAGITDWRLKSEGLNVMALTYYKQKYDMERIAGNIYGINQVSHHLFGRASQEGSFYIDVGLYLANNGSGDINYDQSSRYGGMTTLFASAMEHGVLEQTQGQSQAAVSTVRLIQRANTLGYRIYRATPANWGTVAGLLQNYSSTSKSAILAAMPSSTDKALVPSNALIPASAAQITGQWTGGGYGIEASDKAVMRISNTLNGGYCAAPNLTYDVTATALGYQAGPAFDLTGSSYFAAAYTPLTTAMQFSWEPIEMASGAYVLDKEDLTLGSGEAPFGLKLSRQYHSNRRYDDSAGLGYGWTHNGNVFITERSATDASLGGANHYQMAPFLAALVAAKDLHDGHTNATQWASSALVVHWALEQMRYNAVSVTMGTRSIQFIRMLLGGGYTYVGPPGMNLTLTRNGTGAYVLAERHGNTMTFDPVSLRLSTVTNTSGAQQTYAYDGTTGKLSTITDSFERVLTFAWSGGRIGSVSDGTGRSVSFGYTSGDMTSFTDPEGKVWTYQYDSEHRMTSLKTPQGDTIAENDYDGEGRVVRQRSMGDPNRQWTYCYAGFVNTETNPPGGITQYFHDGRGRSTSTADPLGNRVNRTYDGQDRQTQDSTPKSENTTRVFDADNNVVSETDPSGRTIQYFYDAGLHLQRVRDKRGKDTVFTYTAAHQIQTVTDPLGHVTTYGYQTNGLPHTITDGENKVTTTDYDSTGQANKITFPDGNYQSFSNNARGDVLSTTDPEGRTTTNTWNNRRQLLTTTLPPVPGDPPAVLSNSYDDSGNLASVTDAKGNVTSHTYNPLGKPDKTTQPSLPTGSNAITNTYDARDWLVGSTNSLGHTVVTEYDSAHRATAMTDPLGRRGESIYDANGRPTQAKDPLNRVTKQVWNARGEKEQDADALNKTTGFLYDNNGNRTLLTNRRGKAFLFAYDDANRMVSQSTPTGKTTGTTYFNNNLVKTVTEPSGQTATLTYNGRNLVQTKSDSTGTVTYAYDNSGLLKTVTEGAATISRTYDERGRLKTYTSADGDLIQYKYDANGKLARLTYPDGRQVNYTYNSRNLLQGVTDWANRTTTYQYDSLGRISGITRPNGTSTSYNIDAAGQLLEVRESCGGKLISYLKFTHDAAGQTISRFRAPLVHSAWQQPSLTASVDDDNRLLSAGGTTVTHDADGNMTAGPIAPAAGSVALTYNSRNQLTATGTTGSADRIDYTYDAEGNRRTSTDTKGTTRYVIDGSTKSLLVRLSPDGSKTYYIYGLGLLYEADESGKTKTYHYDQAGSTIARTDDAGRVIGRAEYSAYGLVAWKDGDMNTPFLYNGKHGVTTEASGLLCMRARYYSPFLMRFVNADPSGFGGGNNWYVYAGGNPVSLNDPFGLEAAQNDFWGQVGDKLNALGASAVNASTNPQGAATAGIDRMVNSALGSEMTGPVEPLKSAGVYKEGSSADRGGDFMAAYYTGAGFALGISEAFFGGTAAEGVGMTRVTSWADMGIEPDLNPGRWVQLGEATPFNFWRTGLPGPKAEWQSQFPFLRIEASQVPFENCISDSVPSSSLEWPNGTQKWRGILGQRQMK